MSFRGYTNERARCRSRARSRTCTFRSELALLAAAAALACALPASAGAADATASATVGSEGGEVSATLSVGNIDGKGAELLQRLTLPQLATVLNVTPAQLSAVIEVSEGGSLEALLGGLLSNPTATLGEVLAKLKEGGVGVSPVEQAISALLGAVTETADGLRATLAQVLTDLREDGKLRALAEELALPPAVLEAAQLTTGTAEQAASLLDTTVGQLSSLLGSAGALVQPLTAMTPLVVDRLLRVTEGTTTLVGSPSPGGGLSMTIVNSSAPSQSSGGAAGYLRSASGAFSIVSIKVARNGTILETVSVPRPGRVSVSASALRTLARKAANRSRTRTRRATVASAAASTAGGILSLVLRPRGLRVGSKTPVTLLTTYTPEGGAPSTLRRIVSVHRPAAARHR